MFLLSQRYAIRCENLINLTNSLQDVAEKADRAHSRAWPGEAAGGERNAKRP